jgi:signal transduction histidine kinase
MATGENPFGTTVIELEEGRNRYPLKMALEAVVRHLNLVLERLRLTKAMQAASEELVGITRMIAFDAAAGSLMHSLKHQIRAYKIRLGHKERELRNTDAASLRNQVLEVLREVEGTVQKWEDHLSDSIRPFRITEPRERISVDELLGEVIDRLGNMATSRGCELSRRSEAKQGERLGMIVSVRRNAFLEMMTCLIVNAVEANAKRVVLHASLGTVDDTSLIHDYPAGSPCVVISVIDDGGGIPPQDAEQVFTLGYTSRKRFGAGVGLTLTRLLARREAGEVEIHRFGKASGQPETEIRLILPAASA